MKWTLSHADAVKNCLAIFVVLVVSVVGVKLLMSSHAATGATLSMTASATNVSGGDTVSVTLKEDSGTDPVNSVQASVNYDASQLQYVSMTEGTAFPTVAATKTDVAGIVRVGRATSTPVTGSNAVVTLKFKVLAPSGTIPLSFDKNYSFVVRSTDNSDILTSVVGTTLTAGNGTISSSATMTLNPGTGSAAAGSTINVTVREDSGTTSVNSVQASVGYNASQLQYTGMTEGGTFTNQAATDTGTAGRVRVARSVQSGSSGVSGDNAIVTLSFKVLSSSGSTALTLDKTQSFVVSSSSNLDILNSVAGSTFTVTSTTPSSATLSLSPTSGTYAKDSTISVVVKAASGTAALSTVQASVNYPASQLQFVGVTEGGVFTTIQRTNTSTSGLVDIIRSIPGGNSGVTGTNPVVTITFKVIGSSGSAALTYAGTSALYDDSGTGTNILNTAASTTASYTLTAGSVTPPPPPPPPAGSATLSLSPASGTFTTTSTVSIDVNVTSSTSKVTTVQASVNYPGLLLKYVGTTEGNVFTTVQRTNAANSMVDIIRSVPGGSAGVTGTNTVVTLKFQVIGTSGTAALSYANTTAVYDDSGTGTNILNSGGSTGGSYEIGYVSPTCSSNPSTPGAVTRTASNYTTVTMAWSASTPGSNCTLAGYHVYRDGTAAGDVTSGTSFTDSGLSSGTSYNYTVKAFDTTGHTSVASASVAMSTKADDQAPTTPIGVTASAPDSSHVNLAWSPSTDFPNPGGVGVAGYRIYRNNSSTPTYTVTSGTSFTDTSVSPSTTYSYVVHAYDKLGNESSPSNVVSAKTAPAPVTCTANPSTPTGLTAGSRTMTSVNFSWSASSAATGCVLAGYHVYRGQTLVGSPISASFQDTGLTTGTSYTYTVVAYDTAGHNSPSSTALTIATTTDTMSPTDPTNVKAQAISAGRVDLTWSASTDNIGVTQYKVRRGNTLINTLPASTRSYSDTALQPDTDYSYSVSALDAAGNESNRVLASPNPVHTPAAQDTQAPTIPTSLKVLTVTTSSAIIGWNASTDNVGVTGYHVYRGGIFREDVTNLSYADLTLSPDSSYRYTIAAFDAAGNSSDTAALTVTTLQLRTLVGDLNSDGSVDIFDLSIMMTHWNDVNVPVKYGDIDQDGKVGVFDLSTLLSHLGDKL